MRRKGTATVVLALLGALAACAGQGDQVGLARPLKPQQPVSSDAAPANGAQPAWLVPPAGGEALSPAQVDTSALPEGYPRLVWTEDDGRTVGAYGQEGGCTYVHPELRDQTQQLVRIAFVEVTMSAGPCTMDLRFPRLAVALDAPLGERAVVLERQTIGPQ